MCASSAGNTRGLIEAMEMHDHPQMARDRSSAGNTRGLIEAVSMPATIPARCLSSAGNTRGLIEASSTPISRRATPCLPRGIPAASLKLVFVLPARH